ncbi:MAG: glycosyltransferase family 87 protein [Casimicrobium sp.]
MQQDFNWDLQNYHLYNAHALLGDRYGIDLAPAMFQSYFNPLIDVPYYWLSVVQNWNARWVAFATGCFHGLAAVGLLYVARRSLPYRRGGNASALLVTILGCLTGSFIMGVGTTIGDNTTSVLIMAALALVVTEASTETIRRVRLTRIATAGLLVGVACGLKLTAAPFALALMASVAVLAASDWRARSLRSAVFAVASVAGIAISGGWWYAFLWNTFGNPLFPQFNQIFASPLAASVMYGDPAAWQPRSLLEALAFPFVVVANPIRISEVEVRPFIWPIVYCIALVAVALRAMGKFTRSKRPSQSSSSAVQYSQAQQVVLTFALVSYVVWMFAFGIFRYTVALEMLLPLVAWILIGKLPLSIGWRISVMALIILTSVAALFRPALHERVEFAKKSHRIETPRIEHPESTTVLLVGDVPMAWLLTGFPKEIAAIGLANNFPESSGYIDRANRIIRERGGKVLALVRADSGANHTAADMAFRTTVDSKLRKYGRALADGDCPRYRAQVGQREMYYQLCEVNRLVSTD